MLNIRFVSCTKLFELSCKKTHTHTNTETHTHTDSNEYLIVAFLENATITKFSEP